MKTLKLILIGLLLTSQAWAGGSRDFDGTDDKISFGDVAVVDSATTITFSQWVKHDTQTADKQLLDKRVVASDNGVILIRDDVGSSSGRTDCYKWYVGESSGTGNAFIETATDSATSGVWRYVTVLFTENVAGGLGIYINGVQDANSPVTTSGIIGIDGGAATLQIGLTQASTNDFDGNMFNFEVWSIALSPVLINEAMWKPEFVPQSHILESPLFGNASPELDLSGNARTGTATGTTESTDGPPIMFGGGLPL